MSLHRFERRLAAAPGHLVTFHVLGDPTPQLSLRLALAAVDAGASMLELGLPFSDPCADGPALQASSARALANGTSTEGALEVLRQVHTARPDVPLNLLVYANLVHARGEDAFCRALAEAGASTLLVPDLPHEQSGGLAAACRAHGLGLAQLAGPATSDERLAALDGAADAYLYYAGHQGVTGGEVDPVRDRVAAVVEAARHPVCVGFGLSRPEHVAAALGAGARMAVVGSHLARVLEEALPGGDDACVAAMGRAVAELSRGVHGAASVPFLSQGASLTG